MDVACLSMPSRQRSRHIAQAMAEGIRRAGDRLVPVTGVADACVGYGWKFVPMMKRHKAFAYADLGYWGRDSYYRFSVNGWSPERYVRQGLPRDRFDRLSLTIKPWRTDGKEIIVAGSTAKACADHGFSYQGWEAKTIARLKGCGRPVVYRPKPKDLNATSLGVPMDRRPISEALGSAYAVVTHHSNTAVDALLAGIPVHCETGAAAAFSVPLEEIHEAPLLEGREQFLWDVAWLQWTLDEMRSGEAWTHIRQYL